MFIPSQLNHRHIMAVHEIVQTKDLVCVVMELAERGDLLEHIKRNGATPDFDAKRMFRQVCSMARHVGHSLHIDKRRGRFRRLDAMYIIMRSICI